MKTRVESCPRSPVVQSETVGFAERSNALADFAGFL
jgi:hypothetical protein